MNIATPSLSFRLRVIERLLRCRFWKSGPSRGPPMGASMPGGDSTFITSGAESASCLTQVGPRARARDRGRESAQARWRRERGAWANGIVMDDVHRIITCHPGEKMSVREHDLGEIRDAVAKLCAALPMDYCANGPRARYPRSSCRSAHRAGWLSARSTAVRASSSAAAAAILEEIQQAAERAPATPDVHDGDGVRHCQRGAEIATASRISPRSCSRTDIFSPG